MIVDQGHGTHLLMIPSRSRPFILLATLAAVMSAIGLSPISAEATRPVVEPVAPCKACLSDSNPALDRGKLLRLMAGGSYQFSDPATGGSSARNWRARFGKISPRGKYSAPAFLPPWGLDEVSYERADGSAISFQIFLEANPTIPESAFPRYLRRTSRTLSVEGTATEPVYELHAGPKDRVIRLGRLLDLLPEEGEISVLDENDVYPRSIAVENNRALPVGSDGLAAVQSKVPDSSVWTSDGSASSVLVSTSLPQTVVGSPKLCSPKAPKMWPPPHKKCTLPSGLHRLAGPLEPPTCKRAGRSTGTIEGSGSLAQTIGSRFGIPVEPGTRYSFVRNHVEWSRSRRKAVYRCVNGQCKFSHSETCTQTAQGVQPVPVWVSYTDGYPSSGDPGPWSSESCK